MRPVATVLGLAMIAGCQCGGVAHLDPVPPLPVPSVTAPSVALQMERVRPLHKPKRRALPGEWLDQHHEQGQTFAEWRAGDPVVPDQVRKGLYVQPLGDLSPTQRRIVTLVADYMQRFFGLRAVVLPDLPIDVIPLRATRRHQGGHQILTGYVLDRVLRPRLPGDAAAYISLTAHDLWPGKGWNFVFGQASLRERVGVWSLHRFGDPDAGAEAFVQTLRRTLKVAVHETGHMFSIEHCTAYECVMNGSNHLIETDKSPLWLGPECMAKVVSAGKLDPLARYRSLAAFAKEHGLEREALFFEASMAALDGIHPR